MDRLAVERRYGRAARHRVLRDYFPVGTRYEGERLVRAVYHLHGGTLEVGYVKSKVKTIATTSAYYRTAGGVGVGARVPRDRCTRLDDVGRVGPARCKNSWRGFSFNGDCLDAWFDEGRATMTLLYMHQGRRIMRVQIGDPDVILPCF